jgi:hypothetical protein
MKVPRVSYRLEQDGVFVIENYNWAEPFSNFLPAIAGKWGVPLWAYYVSKGQALAAMGRGDKDGQILPFTSFNLACMEVGRRGFRTFVRRNHGPVYEPFRRSTDRAITQTMKIGAGELVLEEINRDAGLAFEVVYFAVPNLPWPVFVRTVELRNLKKTRCEVEWLDGVCRVVPHGVGYARSQFVARHVEAMMGVVRRKKGILLRLRQSAEDCERIEGLDGGHFYTALVDDKLLPKKSMIADPDRIFGEAVNYDFPWVFDHEGLSGVHNRQGYGVAKTPCAFGAAKCTLSPQASTAMISLLGYVESDDELNRVVGQAAAADFIQAKRAENKVLLGEIENRAFTVSDHEAFDAYCGRNFLDNVIRGGMPEVCGRGSEKKTFYIYSRQNGDLERDYHWFYVEPSYLSQGTGHYRSVLQNRRSDTWFFPDCEDANLHTFMSLIQLDGYNPLEVCAVSYAPADGRRFEDWLRRLLAQTGDEVHFDALWRAVRDGFTPGGFMMRYERIAYPPKGRKVKPWPRETVLSELLALSRPLEVGGLHEGFWVDHWTYNLDLLDSYLAIYPDRLEKLLCGRDDYTFFDDPDVILDRAEKTVQVERDDGTVVVRRYGAVVRDPQKEALIRSRKAFAYRVRTQNGKGPVYTTTLLVKLLTILTNRMATLDPQGRGVEMEADKPGWNDSLNGLPALFGSALNETLELLRCARFLQTGLEELGARKSTPQAEVALFSELADFMDALTAVLRRRLRARSQRAALQYWEQSNTLKETYRRATRYGVDGKEVCWSRKKIIAFVKLCARVLEKIFSGGEAGGPKGDGPTAVLSSGGVPHTYFVNEAADYTPRKRKRHCSHQPVEVNTWRARPVKLFLEGSVHFMKVFPERGAEVYRAVRQSPLFDRKLKMYKSCENMAEEDPELGRAVGAYPRGWIENESIYLHMEYKYLLEILRAGLCDEFYKDIQSALVPFMDPQVYGRSILEGASFVVSSAFADPKHHGQAFQPRLSGITCEFVHIWTLMTAGPRPFRLSAEGALQLVLEPRLAGWLFTSRRTVRPYRDVERGRMSLTVPKNAFAFQFLGHTLVIYRNPRRKNTYGKRGARVLGYALQTRGGETLEVAGDVLGPEHAQRVRAGEVARITADLG